MANVPLCARAAAALPAVVLGASLFMVGQPATASAAPAANPTQAPAAAEEPQVIPAQSVSLNATDLTLMAGSTEALTATVDPANTTDPLSWSSNNAAVADVSADGLVRAAKAGTATVTATAGDAQASCDVTVWQPVTSIDLNRAAFSMEGGEVRQLTAVCLPEDATNKAVTWESSNPKVASVNAQTGLVTGLTEGKATITCKAQDGAGAQKTCEVTVTSTAYAVTDVSQLQSQHPYANNCTDSWTYSIPDAYQLSVTFDKRTSVENTFDYIAVFDKDGSMLQAYTGTALSGATITVPGDTVRIQLITDDQVTDWGFAVTSVEQLYPPKKEEPKPDKPAQPEQPSKPDTPNKPDTPDTPDKPDTPDTPDKPDQPVNPDNPDEPVQPSKDWNLVVAADGTVASDNVTFQLPQAWVGKVDVNVVSDADVDAQELQISLAGHPDLVLASFSLTALDQPLVNDDAYDVPVATWDNGNGQQLELSVVNWAAIAHDPASTSPDTDLLAQLVDLSTGGTMTLEQAQQSAEVPAPPTYGADELMSSAQVPLYVDGKKAGFAVPAAAAVPAVPDVSETDIAIPAATGNDNVPAMESPADQPASSEIADDQLETDQPAPEVPADDADSVPEAETVDETVSATGIEDMNAPAEEDGSTTGKPTSQDEMATENSNINGTPENEAAKQDA